MTEPCDLDASAARRLIGARKLAPSELMESCIARIEAVNHAVNAMVAFDYDRARAAAGPWRPGYRTGAGSVGSTARAWNALSSTRGEQGRSDVHSARFLEHLSLREEPPDGEVADGAAVREGSR